MRSGVEQKVSVSVGRALEEADVAFEKKSVSPKTHAVDFRLRLPKGTENLYIEYHSALAPYQVESVAARLGGLAGPRHHVGLCVRRLTWALVEACKQAHVAVFDEEGNAYVRLPGLYIERVRPGRKEDVHATSGTVFTSKAARLVRAFLKQFPGDWARGDLVRETELSAGYVSILVKRLIAQGFLSDRLGRLYVDDPDRLLSDWAAHYRFDRHRKLSYAISAGTYEEGIKKLTDALKKCGIRFALTGWTGAYVRAPYATATTYMAYVAETPKELSGVFSVERQGNVALYIPQDEGVFQFTTASEWGDIVSDAQLYVDLFRMPGRAKEQADALREARLGFTRINP
jgi:hypothetical protein